MDREEVIKLAQVAGFDPHDMSDDFTCNLVDIERFATLVAAEKEKQIIDILERLQQRNDSHNYYAYAIKVIRGEI